MSFYKLFYFLYFVISFFFLKILFVCEFQNFVFFFSFLNFSSSWSWMEFLVSIDWMGLLFISILFIIAGSVGVFSLNYMKHDIKKKRFFMMLKLFILSMVMLMVVPHYMFFLVGWDGLGFTSFLLMKYYKSSQAWASSLKTFLMKRLGDGMVLSSLGLMLWQGHFSFFLESSNWFLFFFLFLGLLTKSAHFPFSLWLPAAMAAPTPVSALVHSSTLVTAGMYMLLRLVWFASMGTSMFFMILSLVTVFLGSLKAMVSFDSKKVVAFSTLSKLGLMGLSVFLGLVGLSFFHLLAHGVSKALLFISVGSVMKENFHNQDLREFSGIWLQKMFKVVMGLWSIFSLMGVFFLSGFFSKDYLLEVSHYYWMKLKLYVILIFSLLFTFIYSFRLLGMFSSKSNSRKISFILPVYNLKFFFSYMILFGFSLILGKVLSYFILMEVESSFMLKEVIFFSMVIGGVIQKVKKFFLVKKLKFFSGMVFFPLLFLGSWFQKLLDLGLFSFFNSSLKNFQKFHIPFFFSSTGKNNLISVLEPYLMAFLLFFLTVFFLV